MKIRVQGRKEDCRSLPAEPFRVALVQIPVTEGEPESNWERARRHLRRAGEQGARLAVLPEMWWSGYAYRRLEELAEGVAESLRAVGEVARKYGMGIVGSWPEGDGGRIFNTAFVIGPEGRILASYRKVHLFWPMKEDRFLTPGESAVVAELGPVRVGLALCYDLRFPEQARRMALAGAQILVFPSQWPLARAGHFQTLLEARAIENQLFTLGVNRSGKGGVVRFGGGSSVVDPRGRVIAGLGTEEGMLCTEIDLGLIAETRSEICYLDDRVPAVDGLEDL